MFLAQAISREGKDIVAIAAEHFGLSRQTIHKHLSDMVSDGILETSGRTSGTTYNLRMLATRDQNFQINDRPAEDRVWRESFAPLLSGLPDNVVQICNHGFTEMFNNAIEHSEGTTTNANLERTYAQVTLLVSDDGIGIFKKIKDGLGLADEREAILELSKGKVTTDSATHSGEGIFFTTRMFDSFSLLSNELFFRHVASEDDWLIEAHPHSRPGTVVSMTISTAATQTTAEVFAKYTLNGDVPSFARTHVPVKLLLVGDESLVSRSQAKRLLSRFAKFKEVMLDFEGVTHIGQAFADEVFRVYKNQNPEVKIIVLRENDDVKAMIKWVSAEGKSPK
jgi:anti-sigma regulatory factor (Ser/Thr protein kinase)